MAGFASNVDQLNTLINNVLSRSINLLFVSTVEQKVILQESVLKMRKDCTEKEDHVLDVDQLGIL